MIGTKVEGEGDVYIVADLGMVFVMLELTFTLLIKSIKISFIT